MFTFSKLYKSARTLLSQKIESEKDSPSRTAEANEIMATARQQDAQLPPVEMTTGKTTPVQVLTSNIKKRREHVIDLQENDDDSEVVIRPTRAMKKLKTLSTREKHAQKKQSLRTQAVVEIPGKKATSVCSSPRKAISTRDYETESDHDFEGRKRSVIGQKELANDTVARKVHHRFASDEPEPYSFSAAPENPVVKVGREKQKEEEERSGDSEDDAPETITVQESARIAKLKKRDAAKAIEAHAFALREKQKLRKEHKRKQNLTTEEEEARVERIPALTKTSTVLAEAALEADLPLENLTPAEPHHTMGLKFSQSSLLPIKYQHNLPELLPLEYLEDSSTSTSLAATEHPAKTKRSTKTNFTDNPTNKEPKDRCVGRTTYRVAKAGHPLLAPKAASVARSTKEAWLQGRTRNNQESGRVAFSKSFLRKVK